MNDLIMVEDKKVIEYFTKGGLKTVLEDIKKLAEGFEADTSTAKGRAAITAQASKVQKSRKYLEEIRISIVEDWTNKTKAVNTEGRAAKDFLTKLQADIRKPLTDWDNKEKGRISGLELRISALSGFLVANQNLLSSHLKTDLNQLHSIEINDTWDEFKEEAEELKNKGIVSHELAIEKAEKYEKEQIELEEFRREKVIRDKKEREEKAEQEEKERVKKEEELKIEAKKQEAQRQITQDLIDAEQKEKARITAEKKAIELEKKIKQEKIDNDKKEKIRIEREKVSRELAVEEARAEERKRIKDEKKKQDDIDLARRRDSEHRLRINNEAVACLMDCDDMSLSVAADIITMIAKGNIKNISINY